MKEIMKLLSLILAIMLVLPSMFSLTLVEKAQAFACIDNVYVNGAAGDDGWDGSLPVHTTGTIGPKKTIQAGIDIACSGGTVNVAAGTYNLTDYTEIIRSLSLVGAGAASTIINGSSDPEDEVIGIYDLENGSVLISGFSIQHGNWNGIYIDDSAFDNAITINDCVITHNDSIDYGGGIWIDNSNIVTLNRCTISNNSAVDTILFGEGLEGHRATPRDQGAPSENVTAGLGGGIAAFECTLNLNQCAINNNMAGGDLGTGGGIFAAYNTTLNMTDCTVSGNRAGRWGGGIFYGLSEEDVAAATISNCNISNNAAPAGGGLMILASGFFDEYQSNRDAFIEGVVPGDVQAYMDLGNFMSLGDQIAGDGVAPVFTGSVTLNNSTVANNVARWGGGMASAFSTYALNGCTFSKNTAGIWGGGIGTLVSLGSLVNCTIYGNRLTYPDMPEPFAEDSIPYDREGGYTLDDGAGLPTVTNAGGGMASIIGIAMFASDTIAGNSTGSDIDSYGGGLFNSRASVCIFINTIVANNAAVRADSSNCLNRGTFISGGHNIDSLNECGFNATGDQVNTNPLLELLQNNGGPTPTCSVGIDSPAFNRGDNDNAPATDQRGVTRPQAIYCTIGAYEVGLNKSATTPVATGLGNATFTTDIGGIMGLTAYSQLDCLAGTSNLSFPFGYFSFEIVGFAPGATVTITITLPAPLPAGVHYYKCLNNQLVDCTSLISYSPGTNVLVLTIKDGGLGDGDGQANGTIIDPGGPAVRPTGPVTSHSSVVLPPASAPVTLPNLVVQSASLSASSVQPGDTVTVNAIVANRGTVNGTSAVKLVINGSEEARRSVTVEGGKTAPVSFTVTRSQPGSYSVYAGGVPAGSFTVNDLPRPDLLLIISVIFILTALIAGVIYMLGRRQYS
ncbi:MAG: choice-of-anchor U domain-containing protein [Dehalococcoidia bacterium]